MTAEATLRCSGCKNPGEKVFEKRHPKFQGPDFKSLYEYLSPSGGKTFLENDTPFFQDSGFIDFTGFCEPGQPSGGNSF